MYRYPSGANVPFFLLINEQNANASPLFFGFANPETKTTYIRKTALTFLEAYVKAVSKQENPLDVERAMYIILGVMIAMKPGDRIRAYKQRTKRRC